MQEAFKMKDHKKTSKELSYARAMHVLKMLEGLPEQIKDLFVSSTEDDLILFEINTVNFKKKEKERDRVIQLQKQYSLPLRPNQTLREVMIRIKIKQLKKNEDDSYKDSLGGFPGV